jgi:hypothetical protein
MVFCGCKQRAYVQERLLEGCQQQNAIVFVVIEAITQVNVKILDYSRRLLYCLDIEMSKLCL